MIKYRYETNHRGAEIPGIETAGVHGALFMLEMNSDPDTHEGEIEEYAIEPEFLEQLEQYGYITILGQG